MKSLYKIALSMVTLYVFQVYSMSESDMKAPDENVMHSSVQNLRNLCASTVLHLLQTNTLDQMSLSTLPEELREEFDYLDFIEKFLKSPLSDPGIRENVFLGNLVSQILVLAQRLIHLGYAELLLKAIPEFFLYDIGKYGAQEYVFGKSIKDRLEKIIFILKYVSSFKDQNKGGQNDGQVIPEFDKFIGLVIQKNCVNIMRLCIALHVLNSKTFDRWFLDICSLYGFVIQPEMIELICDNISSEIHQKVLKRIRPNKEETLIKLTIYFKVIECLKLDKEYYLNRIYNVPLRKGYIGRGQGTLLHGAIALLNISAIQFLLKLGADTSVKNVFDHDALEFAIEYKSLLEQDEHYKYDRPECIQYIDAIIDLLKAEAQKRVLE